MVDEDPDHIINFIVDQAPQAEGHKTYFFSLPLEVSDASPRAVLCSDGPSELPASASNEA